MKQQSLISSTIILTLTYALARTLHIIFSILLAHKLSAEVIGIHELTMSIYCTAIAFSSAGLCSSISRLIAEELGKSNKLSISYMMNIYLIFALLIGTTVTAILFYYISDIVLYFTHTKISMQGLKLLVLSIPSISISSCLKGYFYALKKTSIVGTSNILEQVTRFLLLITLINYYSNSGAPYIFIGIGISFTAGEFISCFYLLFYYIKTSKYYLNCKKVSPLKLLKNFFHIFLPLAMISYISYVFFSLEDIIVPKRLALYSGSFSSSLSALGIIKGMVFPLLFFPTSVLSAFSSNLLPKISELNALGQFSRIKNLTSKILHFTFLLSFYILCIFITYSSLIGYLIYKNNEIGPFLHTLSITIPFMYSEVITDTILKGLDKQSSCLTYSLLDCMMRSALFYLLLPYRGVSMFTLILIISCIFTSVLHFNKLIEVTHIHIHISNWFFKPILAASFAANYCKLIMRYLFHSIHSRYLFLMVGLFILTTLYLFTLFLLEDFKIRPFSEFKLHPTSN